VYNWTHKKWCRPSDPINIVFEGISLDEVEKFLLGQGWQPASFLFAFASSHVIPDPDPINKRPQDRQLIKPIKFKKIPKIKKILKRLHIRLWDIGNKIIAGIHIDALRVPGHSPTDFESVEKFFAEDCKQNSNWEVLEDAEDLDNRIAGHGQPYNNGKATIIRRRVQ